MSTTAPIANHAELGAARAAKKRRATDVRIEKELELNKLRGAAHDQERDDHEAAELEYSSELETRWKGFAARIQNEFTPLCADMTLEPTRATKRKLGEAAREIDADMLHSVGEGFASMWASRQLALCLIDLTVEKMPAAMGRFTYEPLVTVIQPASNLTKALLGGSERDIDVAFADLEHAIHVRANGPYHAGEPDEMVQSRYAAMRGGGSINGINAALAVIDDTKRSAEAEAIAPRLAEWSEEQRRKRAPREHATLTVLGTGVSGGPSW